MVLALFAYPLLVNLLNGGPSLMWQWVKAKWVNAGAPAVGSSSSSSGPTPTSAGYYSGGSTQQTTAPTGGLFGYLNDFGGGGATPTNNNSVSGSTRNLVAPSGALRP